MAQGSAAGPLAVPELVAVPGGTFVMGSDSGLPDERPVHPVTLSPFRAGAGPVTNLEYARFVAAGGRPGAFEDDPRFADPALPTVGASWYDATAYCVWLAQETGIPFRLPSEAEREYAARGGLSGGDWPWRTAHPSERAIARANRPHVPASECANGYGLRCMAENVHEWCSDWYDPAGYSGFPVRNPRGPTSGERRVSRGGSWRHAVKFTRVSARASLAPERRYNDFGFRVYASA